jgi:alpha-glucosidase (family GH31 glycosyl hydrolase)
VTLNVHPADGIRAFEDAYPRVAEAMDIDPATEQPVTFDPTDPKFMDVYFRLLHHPLEEEGVDFWWLDWQQGSQTRIPGVDPLWLLNITHFLDSGRDARRAITFSRYAGPGSHRYPVGFSGDTVISWASLDFQPHFTSTASNIGYGWWSHDIGGHWFGARDDVLSVRWAQFGVFSPIMRLHSTLHPFIRKEPWSYGPEARAAISAQLRLRHRLVPYLHTMNARSAHDGVPLIEPMYWRNPDAPQAYRVPNEYRFGTELIVAPITTPQNRDLLLGSTRAWLPPGRWTDIFTGVTYEGGREVRLHRTLDTIPVMLHAGGILPLAGGPGDKPVWAAENPGRLEILLAPGADGQFDLKEEDGTGDGRDLSRWVTTRIRFDTGRSTLTIGAADGNTGCIPSERDWTVTVVGAQPGSKAVGPDGSEFPATQNGTAVSFAVGRIRIDAEMTIRFDRLIPRTWARLLDEVYELLDRAHLSYDTKQLANDAVRDSRSAPEAAARVQGLELSRDLESALLEVILADYALRV